MYNAQLANRVREKLQHLPVVEEKKMMGGLTFMVNEKMCIGIVKDDLMVRLDPEVQDLALERPGARVMDFTHKPMKGFVFVDSFGTEKPNDLQYWVDLALDYNKRAKASKKKKKA